MAKKVIKVEFNSASVRGAIKELENYRKRVKTRQSKLLKRLAEIGGNEAGEIFSVTWVFYDIVFGNPNIHPVNVDVKPTANGYAITASGEEVAFLEFGAGVTHGGGYKGKIPSEVSGVGEYGKGKGKRSAWGYSTDGAKVLPDESNLVVTRGNEPAMGMYYASKEIQQQVLKIAREVFADD